MWLKSIELSQVGTFGQPVRIDGLGPGLNVLAGSNELGKSTILRGLMALFTEAHRTAKQSIKDLRPYHGGAPFVGCTFALGTDAVCAGTWRLEKQYLAAQRALLERIGGGETHHGVDAENRLTELMEATCALPANLPMLWVEQGKSFDVPVLTDGARASLGQLLAAQAESTSGVGGAQVVLGKVREELRALVTKTDKVKKGGAYDKLLAERTAVAAALDEAQSKLVETEQRLAELARLENEEAECSNQETSDGLSAKIASQKERLREAQEASRHLQQINVRVEFLTQQQIQRAGTLARFDEGLAELRTLTERMQGADVELTRIASAITDVEERQSIETELASEALKNEQALRSQLDRARAATALAATRERLSQLTEQKQRLDVIANELADIDRELVDLDWPDGSISELRQALGRLGQIEARKAAGAPRLKVNYLPGVYGGITVGGEALGDGAEVIAGEPIIMEIEGLGHIEITPGASDARDELEDDLARTQSLVAELLAAMKAKDLADAETRDYSRRAGLEKHKLLTRELHVLAPSGRDPINAEIELLEAALAKPDTHEEAGKPVVSIDELVEQIDDARAKQARAQSHIEALKAERSKLDERRTAIATELRIRRTRRDELETLYVRQQGDADPRLALVAQVDETEQALNAATRERIACQEVVLSDNAMAELQQSIAAAEAHMLQRSQRLGVVRQDMRRIEGMLARDFEDGTGETVDELKARMEDLNARVGAMELHIEALRLLSTELADEIARRRDEISRPLARRMSGLAQRIWPTAEIPLTSELIVDGLLRDGQLETANAVSAGTREQMAVLARLAYAGLLSDGGEGLPIILDDPLVFSDDNRLGGLFEVMVEAAEAHQIIVLTCHERAFEPLVSRYGASRLTIDVVEQLRAVS